MSDRLVPAYSVTTNNKLPYLVPERLFEHPLYRGKIRRTPKAVAAQRAEATRRGTTRPPASAGSQSTTPQTPAAGDEKEK